jgi:hypothetical protein
LRRLAALAEEVAGHWPHLPVLEKQIRETVQEVETSMVEVCNGFEGMATRARESVEAASRLAGPVKVPALKHCPLPPATLSVNWASKPSAAIRFPPRSSAA